MLKETTLFGEIDRVQTAIDRLRFFAPLAEENHPNGYVICDSGGKDSNAIKTLALLSGVKFEILHNHTTADHPLTVRYVREECARWRAQGVPYTIRYPTYKGKRTSMWELIPLKCAPTRVRRWCCDILKERGGMGRYCVTGVRWAESPKRKSTRTPYEVPGKDKYHHIRLSNDNDVKRLLTERCITKAQFILNPIIDWQDEDVWELIHLQHIPYNPLYDLGYRRVGCVGCPMSRIKDELETNPKFAAMYLRAFDRYVARKLAGSGGCAWQSGQELFDWWVNGVAREQNDDQLNIYDFFQGEDDALF